MAGRLPAILDPFAGGGSIPLEAQRLGLEAHASDLNPVAVLINKALIEIPPKWAEARRSSPAWRRSNWAFGRGQRVWRKTFAGTGSGLRIEAPEANSAACTRTVGTVRRRPGER